MVERFFVGDKVETKRGIGRIVRIKTWRDAIVDMDNDYEAEEFCARCKAEVGIGFREDWVKVWVEIHGISVPFQSKDVKLLEGRNVYVEVGLGKGLIKKSGSEDGEVGRDRRESKEKAGREEKG